MADIKISQLPSATTPLAGTEEVPLVQSGTTKKVTVSNLRGSSVTAVTATAPVVSSGGTTPVISMAAATTSVNGYLTSTDWNTFNNKQPAGSYLTNGGALGTPSSGTATNLTGLPLTTGVTGLLPVANGGTGTASPSIVAGTNVTVSGTWPNQTINASGGSGGGDVTGPGSSTDNAVARFDSTTGKIIQNSSVVINDGGEITTGVWKGTEIGLSYGGTGGASASQARSNILPSYTGNAGKVLAVNTGATDVEYISAGGTGTVTSVQVSGGTTGLTASGGPITAAGTITLAGTLAVANGGTGTATPALVAGTNVTITGTWPNQTINSSGGGSMTYPGAGIANSTGSAWGTSYTTTGTGTVVALATSPALTTPTLSGATVGNAAPYLNFNDGASTTLAAGRMWYDGTTGAWNLGMGGGNITQQVGEELFVYGKASTAITDSPLQIIYQTGTVGASGAITFAPTVSGITNGESIIGVATESLALNAFGRVTAFGVVRGITTDGSAFGETWADGDAIWYNPTTGNPTKTKPSAPNIKTQVGTVIKAGAGGSGSFQVEVNHGSSLGGTDSNVNITSVANLNLLQYDSTAQYWKNVAPSTITAGTVTTNANLTGAVTSVGNATSLGSFTSAQLATALTDETGTGSAVFATSPTLVTPVLGTPTSGNFSTGTFTWPTFNQNTSGTAAGLSATLAVTSGGTGQSSALTQYGIVFASTTGAMATTAAGTAGYVLTSNGTSAPTFQAASGGLSRAQTTAISLVFGF
tara:strand:+ start:1603 stop:3870 length:2268 start_codon:yes stop_codon:yes gene_type:complete